MDEVVRARLRALRQYRDWSLHDLAERSGVGASTISRLETGKRTLSFDVLVPLARALDSSIDELVATDRLDTIVIRPEAESYPGMTVWSLTKRDSQMVAAKIRFNPVRESPELKVHAGYDWIFVLEGTVTLQLDEDQVIVQTGESAEFSTMTPHAIFTRDHPSEVLMVFDHNGAHAHLS